MENTQSNSQSSSMTTDIIKPSDQFSPLKQKENKGEANANFYFQTETKRLKTYYLEHQEQIVGRKILFNNSSGVVKYFGPLLHTGKPVNSVGQLWIGIEWDQLNRGKHNGTVNGYQYFSCPQNQGSMIKYQKIQFGYRLETALFKRYFRAEQLHHAKSIYDNLKQVKQELKGKEGKEGQQNKVNKIQEVTKKVHKVEYDAEAYFETNKKSKKIMIQFIGFDQIWSKINNLDKIQSISLADCRICDLGQMGHLNRIFQNLRILSLEDNLISDWHQVYQLGYELPQLNELSLSNNHIHPAITSFSELQQITVVGRDQKIPLKDLSLFSNLKCLILINTKLTWKTFFNILPVFGKVNEFILCKNNLSDVENIDQTKLHFMSSTLFLNLQETSQADFSKLSPFSTLPHLQKLILNKNPLKKLGRQIKGFTSLKSLSVQNCEFNEPIVLYEISNFPNLQSLNVKHNPIGEKYGNSYVRMRAVAEIKKLNQINGALLKKYERKDCEIFYLRQSFREYFAVKKVPDYDYDFQDFIKYCNELHPNIKRLINMYGNPFEVQKQKQIQALIKEEVKVTENKKGTGMVDVKIIYKQNEVIDRKKVPLSWTLSSLKNFFSKTIKIPVGMLKLTCIIDESATEGELMSEDHKTLSFYNLKSGSQIVVERIVL